MADRTTSRGSRKASSLPRWLIIVGVLGGTLVVVFLLFHIVGGAPTRHGI